MSNRHQVNWCHTCHRSVYYRLSQCTKCGSATERRAAPPPLSLRNSPASVPSQNSDQNRIKAIEQELKMIKQGEHFAASKKQKRVQPNVQDATSKLIELEKAMKDMKGVLGDLKKDLPSHPSSHFPSGQKPSEATDDRGPRNRKRKRHHLNQSEVKDEAKVDDSKILFPESLDSEENPFLLSDPADPSAKNAKATKFEKSAAKPGTIVQLPGIHGWNKIPLKIDGWCYEHSHGVKKEEGCKPGPFEHLPYPKPLVCPVEIPVGYSPILRDDAPRTFWQGILELARFSLSLYAYGSLAEKRDSLQLMVSRAMAADMTNAAWSAKIQHQIVQYCPRVNIVAAQFHHTLQRLAKHCYSLYCDRLLQEMHKHRIARGFSVGKVFETHAVVIGLQSLLRTARTAAHPSEDPDLPIREKDLVIWQEFVDHVCRESTAFSQTVSDLRSSHARDIKECLSKTPYAPVVDLLTTGGFGPKSIENRTHALPVFLFKDVDSIKEKVRQNLITIKMAQQEAENEKKMVEQDPDTLMDDKPSNQEDKEQQSAAPENTASKSGSQDDLVFD